MSELQKEQLAQIAIAWNKAQPVVSAYVYAMVYHHDDAEDLIQQVAVIVITKFESYDASRPFNAWALGIARNKILQYLQKRKGDRLSFGEQAMAQIAQAHQRTAGDAEALGEPLEKCLDKLPKRSRQLLVMRYVENLKSGAIAKHLELNTTTVTSVLHRARQSLRRCITQQIKSQEGL